MRAEVFLLGLISFLIVAFGQPSFAVWLGPIAASLGYALFWKAIRIYPFKTQRFWRATLWYASITLVQLSWMSSIEFQGVYILFVWFGLSLFWGFQFGLLSVLIPYNQPLKFGRILAIASLWTLLEWGRFHILCGYSWNLAGLSYSDIYSLQFASVFGILGLSFWVIFVNLLGLKAFIKKRIPYYLCWVIAAGFPYLYGVGHLTYHEKQIKKFGSRNTLSCVLVQTGLLPSEKIPLQGRVRSFISPYDQWERILLMVKDYKDDHPDLIVLPEAAISFLSNLCFYEKAVVEEMFLRVFESVSPEIFPKEGKIYLDESTQKVSNAFLMQALSNHFGCEVITGLDHHEGKGVTYNSAFHFTPFNGELERYDKRVLMPLAEYLPFSFLTPLVKSYGITDFFTHGKEAKVFQGRVPISTSICYEETFPHKIREGRKNGSKFFVNLTNDGWYPFSHLPSEHFEHAKFRAIENGVPLVRACNTGITGAIDSLGRIKIKLEECAGKKSLQSGAVFVEMDLYEYPTLYLLWGNKGIVILSLVFLSGFIALKREMAW